MSLQKVSEKIIIRYQWGLNKSMKWIVSLILVAGLVLSIYSASLYFQSGELVHSISLAKTGSSLETVDLSPDMNPIRVLLNTRYVSRTKNQSVNFYSYNVKISAAENTPVFTQSGVFSLHRKSEDIPPNELSRPQRRTHNLGVFDVASGKRYAIVAQLKNKKADISRADIEIRRNVETQLPMSFWLGLALFFGGIVLGFFVKNKK